MAHEMPLLVQQIRLITGLGQRRRREIQADYQWQEYIHTEGHYTAWILQCLAGWLSVVRYRQFDLRTITPIISKGNADRICLGSNAGYLR